jgi:hypothetical protein
MAKQQMRIGTRASALALWQAEWVKSELEKRYPEMEDPRCAPGNGRRQRPLRQGD